MCEYKTVKIVKIFAKLRIWKLVFVNPKRTIPGVVGGFFGFLLLYFTFFFLFFFARFTNEKTLHRCCPPPPRRLPTGVDGQQQVGAARRHAATVRRVRGRQHAGQTGKHVGAHGRVGLAERPVPPAPGRPGRGPVARRLDALVAGAVAAAADAAPGPVAAADRGRETPRHRRGRAAVFRRLPGYGRARALVARVGIVFNDDVPVSTTRLIGRRGTTLRNGRFSCRFRSCVARSSPDWRWT